MQNFTKKRKNKKFTKVEGTEQNFFFSHTRLILIVRFFINEEKKCRSNKQGLLVYQKNILVLPQLKNYIYVCKQSPVLYINWLNTN